MGALRKKVANVLGSYYSGNVIQKDYVEAVKWYRKAAEQGHAIAQYTLGCRYDSGEGVTQDDVEAVKWYRKAAEQGYAIAQNNLGLSYASGEGVTQDDVEAVKWYRKAAEQGDASAQYNLGWSYASGEGVTQDDVEAVKWYRKAAEQGDASAQQNLGWLLFDRGDLDGTEESFRKALSAQERSLGPEHATTLSIIAALGMVVSKIANNKHDESEDLFLRAHTGFKNTLGLEHPQTLECIRLLGSNKKKRGDVEGAINCLKKYFDHSEATRDGLAFNLACYECLNGNFEEAKALITEHLERHPDAKEQALSDADLESIHDFIGNV
ncbi:tetratricopeptide repeat protein [Akkermansiaceae bacterium]|nr:tetratricopeptide repeat protein [Akkermansiaceae bacterium]